MGKFIDNLLGRGGHEPSDYEDDPIEITPAELESEVRKDIAPTPVKQDVLPDPLLDDATLLAGRLSNHTRLKGAVEAKIAQLSNLLEDLNVVISAEKLALSSMTPRLTKRDEDRKLAEDKVVPKELGNEYRATQIAS